MGIMVLKRRFEAPPSKDEILNLLVGEVGDKGRAKDALINILAPMKDLLAVLAYTETMDAAAEQYAKMLQEQEAVSNEIQSLKTQTAGAKEDAAAAVKKLDALEDQIENLERKRDAVAAEILNEEDAKLRVSKTVEAEYDKLRREMLAKLTADEKEARKELDTITNAITVAQADLDSLAAKKAAFIASLTK
jgi:chromosome segregation ATPase